MDEYWSQSPADLLAALQTSAMGLTQAEAEKRLCEVGPNRLTSAEAHTAFRLLLRQYESPLVLILIFGALVSFGLRQWTDATIIMAIVLGSTLLGFGQEYHATAAIKRLRERIALTSAVLRDGQRRMIDAALLVPGDVILLSAGNLVPADGIVLEARDFIALREKETARRDGPRAHLRARPRPVAGARAARRPHAPRGGGRLA